MKKRYAYLLPIIALMALLPGTALTVGNSHDEQIIRLMEDIFTQIPQDITTIDARLQRIAVYHINIDEHTITPSMRSHFESRLVEKGFA